MADQLTDNKYLVFKTEELIQLFGKHGLPKDDTDCAPIAEAILKDIEAARLDDAIVIRKQDVFAGPALHVYASTIGLAAQLIDDPETVDRLSKIADYFHEEALDADAVKAKLPD